MAPARPVTPEAPVPVRPLLARCGLALLVLLGGTLVAVGGISLGVGGLVAVASAGVLAACVAAGLAREGGHPDPRQAVVESAWRTAVGAVATLLLSGAVVLVGAALTALASVSVLGALLVRWALRAACADRQATATPTALPHPDGDRRPGPALAVGLMSVPELGQEWVHSSAALARTRDAGTRQELVRRRSEALDELERRDPVGSARWLEAGATVDSDPAEYVSGDPAAGSAAA